MWRRQQTTISSLQTIQRTTRLKICMMSMSKAAPDALLTRYSSRPTVHELLRSQELFNFCNDDIYVEWLWQHHIKQIGSLHTDVCLSTAH